MKMFVRKEVLLLILGLTITRTVAQVTCSDNFQLMSGNVEVLFCKYDPSFISVRWYKDNSKVPVAVIERGKRIVSGGYDIADNGTLIISKVSVQHEGTYRISVLDGNGDIESQNVTAFVIVPSSEEPLIQTCSSSGSKECLRFSEEERGNVLICESKETRPAVDFIWTNLISNEAVTVNGAITNTVMNASTSLYSSFSTLRFNPNDFSLQLFTCTATGKAVNTPMASSLLVTGLRDVMIIEKGYKMIEQGGIITIDCPKSDFALGTLEVIHTDDTRRTLAIFSAGSYDMFCEPETRCTVSGKGEITINDVTFQDEGVYECVCSDGGTDGKYLTNVDILIKPAPEKIVIEGCKDSSKCEKAVTHTGTIKASVFGARPSVELTCVLADASTAFIYNHQSRVQDHPEEGMFDTFFSIDFDIDECSAPVHITCMVSPGTTHDKLNVSNIFLITDTSTCEKGNTSLAILLVIFFIILVATSTFILYIKREQVINLRDQCFPHKAEEAAVHYARVAQSDVDPPKADTGLDDPVTTSQTFTMQNEVEREELYNSEFEDLYGKIQTEKISQEDFKEEMKEFSKTKNKNLPQSFLSFMMKKDLRSNEPWKVLQFIGESVPCSKITALEFARRLSDLVMENKIAVDKFLNVAENFYIKKKISMRNYVEITGPLLRSDAVPMNAIMKEFTTFEKQKASKSELADGLVQYFMNYCEDKDELRKLYRENNLIPYPYLLQSVYRNIRQCVTNGDAMFNSLLHFINESDKCLEWFEDIILSQSREQLQKDVDAIGNNKSGEQLQKDGDAVGNDKSGEQLQKDVDAIDNDKSGEPLQKDVDAVGNDKSGDQLQNKAVAIDNDKSGEQLQKDANAVGNDKSGEQLHEDLDAVGNNKSGEQLQKDLDAIDNDKALSLIFLKSLFLGVAAKSIEASECAEILSNSRQGNGDKPEKDTSAMGTDERKVANEQIIEVLVIFSEKNTFPWNAYADILYCGLEKNLIKESFYLKHLQPSEAKSEIEFSRYIGQLKRCIVNQKITNALKLILFNCTTKAFKINEQELQSIVKATGISKEERNRILKGVKTHGLFGSSKVKGK